MIKLFEIKELNSGATAWLNPDEIQAIYDMGSGPNNIGHTRIYMNNKTIWDIEGYTQDLIKILTKRKVLETWDLKQKNG